MDSAVYNELNRAWKSTCRTVLKGEMGELIEFEDWLKQYMLRPRIEKSASSGKEVYLAVHEYCKDARFIGLDELNFNKKFEPISINQAKDIDSVVEALQDRFLYTGNIVLGKSNFVARSTSIQNSNYVYNSSQVFDSNRIAHSHHTKLNENVFGGEFTGENTKFCIRVCDTYNVLRSLEAWNSLNCGDCYYVFGLTGSQECMFSFNLKSRKYCIGNLSLERDKYMSLKDKLLTEVRERLSKEKKLLTLIDLVTGAKDYRKELKSLFKEVESRVDYKKEEYDKQKMEKSFEGVSQIILGRKLTDMDSYSSWFLKHIKPLKLPTSVISGRKITLRTGSGNFDLFPKERIVTIEEANVLSEKLHLDLGEAESLNLDNAGDIIGKIAYSNIDYAFESKNCLESATPYYSRDCYRVGIPAWSNESGYSFWPRNADHMFGTDSTNTASFCIHTYYSVGLSRAFETDNCTNCSDVYFAHNCENVRNSMFCFNAKNLSNAVGNAVYAPEQYKKIKDSLVAQIADELELKKDFKWDIYNVGCCER